MRFPRNTAAGWVLTAICMLWFGFNFWSVDLGGFNQFKRIIFAVVPIGVYLIATYIPDLLALRGVCGVMLLGAAPLMAWTRWQEGPASIAVVLFCYAGILKAMMMMIYPNLWKRNVLWIQAHPEKRTALLGAGGAFAALMLICGLMSL